ncbi:MAG: response regulator receiver protein, partial [Chloroflexi bacterium]|nr:response regulator receiver protein [Chloroflexota bacterium]
HRQLMSCLWAAGRRDEALRQFQECRRILARELDIEPLAETQALYAKINKD